MTNVELDLKIADTMARLRADKVVDAIKESWSGYFEELKKEARKSKRKGETIAKAADRLSESDPCDMYCYIMFNDEGDLEGWTIDGSQYWQGHGGPTSAISVSSQIDYKEIEREIENDLAEALDIEEDDSSPDASTLSLLTHNDLLGHVYYKDRLIAAKLGKNWGKLDNPAEPAVTKAVAQAIFSMPNNTSALELRRRIGEYLTAR
jgi:hypothetical protein